MAAGEYTPHLKRIRRNYCEKARIMGDVLEASPLREQGWGWERPLGGLYYWMRAPEGFDLSIGSDFCERCIATGVLYVPGDLCVAEGEPKNFARLSFGSMARDKLVEATERFHRRRPGLSRRCARMGLPREAFGVISGARGGLSRRMRGT